MTTTSGLPSLAADYALRQEDIQSYGQNGHVLLRSVCSAEEVEPYHRVISEAAYRYSSEQRPMEERDTYGRAFLQIMNLWQADENVRLFTTARRFAKIAAQLMGVSGVRLYHDQALYKEAGGGHTPWHQDFYYWPLDTAHTVTLWMPLVDAESSMGTLTFASGSHKEGYLGPLGISDESEEYFQRLVEERGFPLSHSGDMAAGDATFHSGAVLHNAPGNSGTRTREAMTVIYFAEGTRVSTPDNPNRALDLKTWLPGLKPGDEAASPLNPLLYPV